MPKKSWSAKRERQYAHIKDSLLKRGKVEEVGAEIAAAPSIRSGHNRASPSRQANRRSTPCRQVGAVVCDRIKVRVGARWLSFATRRRNVP